MPGWIRCGFLWLFLSAPFNAALGEGKELVTTLADQEQVAVTIYNDDLALVKDRRKLDLRGGDMRIAFREVSARIQPETALLKMVAPEHTLRIREQNFNFDLLSPATLLEKYLGKQLVVVRVNPATGSETRERATLLSTNQGTVFRFADRIETNPGGHLVFSEVPKNLRDRPTLVVDFHSDHAGESVLELDYLTGGLSWRADYVAQLSDDDSLLDLQGWVTLNNQSGTQYPNARLQLVAGSLNRVRPPQAEMLMSMAREKNQAADTPTRERLFEYHLYRLPGATTIADRQTKQVSLLNAGGIAVRKQLVMEGNPYYYQGRYVENDTRQDIQVDLELVNTTANNLGFPLPEGVVRVYKKDGGGDLQFVGEDRVSHTPENETIRLRMGQAFDVTGYRVQTQHRKLPAPGRYQQAHESSFRVTVKNAKPDAVTVVVREPLPGDWQILSESDPHQKISAQTAEWRIKVPAKGETVLTYDVLVRF